MQRLNRISGIFLLLFSIFALYESSKLSFGDLHNPGAGFMPTILGVVLTILSLLLIFSSIKKEENIEDLNGELEGYEGWQNAGLTLGSLFLYTIFLETTGFIIATVICLVFIMRFVEKLGWKTTLLFSLPSTIITYLIFSRWLGVPLPKGFLGI